VQEPKEYEMHCDICKGTNITWSEYDHMIWCYDCQKDTKGFGGVFEGPIAIGAMSLLGMSLDRINLRTGKRSTLRMNENGHIEYVEVKNA